MLDTTTQRDFASRANPRVKKPLIEDLVWSKQKRVYYRNNRPVTAPQMAKLVDSIAQQAGAEVDALARKLIAGTINEAEFAIGMAEQIKRGHRAMAILSYGGAENMTPKEWGRVGQLVKAQNGFLANFVNQIENGEVALGDALAARARLYMEALYGSYQNLSLDREKKAGVMMAKRLLSAAQHCPQCPGYQRTEWTPIDEITPIGVNCDCKVNCRCTIVYGEG